MGLVVEESGQFLFIYGKIVIFLDHLSVFEKDYKRHGTVCQWNEFERMEIIVRKYKSFTVFSKERNCHRILILMCLHEKYENRVLRQRMTADDAGHLRDTMLAMFAGSAVEAYGTFSGQKPQTVCHRSECLFRKVI